MSFEKNFQTIREDTRMTRVLKGKKHQEFLIMPEYLKPTSSLSWKLENLMRSSTLRVKDDDVWVEKFIIPNSRSKSLLI